MKISNFIYNLGESLKTKRNVRKVQSMLNKNFITDATKLNGGAFEVRGFRRVTDYYSPEKMSNAGSYSIALDTFKIEKTPSCIVKYNPKIGLETTVRSTDKDNEILYRITQKIGEKPVVDESIAEKASPDLKSLVETRIEELKKAIGRYIPTLDNIKH